MDDNVLCWERPLYNVTQSLNPTISSTAASQLETRLNLSKTPKSSATKSCNVLVLVCRVIHSTIVGILEADLRRQPEIKRHRSSDSKHHFHLQSKPRISAPIDHERCTSTCAIFGSSGFLTVVMFLLPECPAEASTNHPQLCPQCL